MICIIIRILMLVQKDWSIYFWLIDYHCECRRTGYWMLLNSNGTSVGIREFLGMRHISWLTVHHDHSSSTLHNYSWLNDYIKFPVLYNLLVNMTNPNFAGVNLKHIGLSYTKNMFPFYLQKNSLRSLDNMKCYCSFCHLTSQWTLSPDLRLYLWYKSSRHELMRCKYLFKFVHTG